MPAKSVLDTRELLDALSADLLSPAQLLKRFPGVSRPTLHRKLTVLVDEGLAVQEGSGAASKYRLKRQDELVPQLPVPPDAPRKVYLEMSEATARIVYEALDAYSRIGIGQFDQILELARDGRLTRQGGEKVSYEHIQAAEPGLAFAKSALLGFTPNASHGVHSQHVHPAIQEAWAVAKSIRHRLAWDSQPQGDLGVWHDEPLESERVEGLDVYSGHRPPQMVDVSELPAGMLLQLHKGKYRVVAATEDGEAYRIVSESRSWQTAITRAKNIAAGRPGRGGF